MDDTDGQEKNRNKRGLFKFKPYVFTQCVPYRNEAKPKARSGHRIVCDDKYFYSYGGYNPSLRADALDDGVWPITRPLFREVWRFHLTKKIWTKLEIENVPHVLASNCVTLQGNLLIVYGGTGIPFGNASSNDIYLCDLSKTPLRFEFIPVHGELPEPRYGQALHVRDKYLYSIGGTTGYTYSCDVHRLDLSIGRWEECYIGKGTQNEPSPRYRHEIAADNEKIYILGGGTSDTSFDFKRIPVFNLDTHLWSFVVTEGDQSCDELYPQPRRFHCAVTVESTKKAIIMGGFDQDQLLNDSWLLDLKTHKWSKLRTMDLICPINFQASTITSAGKIYLFGGVVRRGDDMSRISMIWSAWAGIPSLKEICWEALVYYGAFKGVRAKQMKKFLPLEFNKRL